MPCSESAFTSPRVEMDDTENLPNCVLPLVWKRFSHVLDLISDRNLVTGNIDFLAINQQMTMIYELPSGLAGFGKTQSINERSKRVSSMVRKTSLSPPAFFGSLKHVPKLFFGKSIHHPELLLFNKSFSVIAYFPSEGRSVLARWVCASFEGFVGWEDCHPKPPIDSCGGSSVST